MRDNWVGQRATLPKAAWFIEAVHRPRGDHVNVGSYSTLKHPPWEETFSLQYLPIRRFGLTQALQNAYVFGVPPPLYPTVAARLVPNSS